MKSFFEVTNPYNKQKIADVPNFSPVEIEDALERAHAYRVELNAQERARILEKTAEALEKKKAELAALITSESGLCLKDTRHEVGRAAQAARFSAKVAELIDRDGTARYDLIPDPTAPKLRVISEALDLVAGITPFNHPLNQVAHKVFPAVAAGACMVLKPSSKTPLAALRLREILSESGLPEAMLIVATGTPADALVRRLVTDSRVDMVTFTGGLEAGRLIVAELAGSDNALKRYVPELGGCSSLIVHEDAEVERAVAVALAGCFANSGQRCTAVRRIVAVGKVADAFVEAMAAGTAEWRCGDPMDPASDMGTLISEAAAREVQLRVGAAVHDGARLLHGNRREGAQYGPTLLDEVELSSRLVAEETFGPVAAVLRVKNLEEAIAVAGRTRYRLAGAVMTRDPRVAERVSRALGVGQFNWNGPPGYRTEAAPFGGFGDSGNGAKEGVLLAAEGMRRLRTFYEHDR